MKARKLLEGASYGPDTLRALFQAFDEAWATLEPRYGGDRAVAAEARVRLANILLRLAQEDGIDAGALRDAALREYDCVAGPQ